VEDWGLRKEMKKMKKMDRRTTKHILGRQISQTFKRRFKFRKSYN
jgi:hypothetical protein